MKNYCLIVYGSPSGSDVIEVWGPFDSKQEALSYQECKDLKEGWTEIHLMKNPYVPVSRSITG